MQVQVLPSTLAHQPVVESTTTNPQPQVSSLKGVGRRAGTKLNSFFYTMMLMMPRMWVAATTQWYKSHRCRRYKSYWESILRQLPSQNWKQRGWEQLNSWISTIPPLLLPRLQKITVLLYFFCFSMLLVCLFVFSIYSNNFSINFCIQLKNPIRLTSAIVFIWSKLRCLWWLLCLQLKASKNLGPWRPLDFVYFIFCKRTHKSRRHTESINHSAEQF